MNDDTFQPKPANEVEDQENLEVKKITEELARVSQRCEEYLEGWKRAKADYLNLQKESEKRNAEFAHYANAALLAGLLPIIDHFKLAVSHIPEPQRHEPWVKGFEHIQKQFSDFLRKLGIDEIKTVGEPFNPSLHEAIVHEKRDDVEPDIIFEEVRPGYTLHGKVLQVANVKVAK